MGSLLHDFGDGAPLGRGNSHQPEPIFFFFNSHTNDGLKDIVWLVSLGSFDWVVSLSKIFSSGVFLTIKVLIDVAALSVV